MSSPTADGEGVRLQKVLAAAGVASRRASEELIAAGRVTVDGETVREMGVRVDPDVAVVEVDGSRVTTAAGVVHLALNKPEGVLSAMQPDPQEPGRPTVGGMVRDRTERLFHVGRLDVGTEGLLLLTGDGDLANALLHPSAGVQKTYLVGCRGPVPRPVLKRLRKGVDLDGRAVDVDDLQLVDQSGDSALLRLTIHEGRSHVVRRLMEEVGHPVQRLARVGFGPVELGTLKTGRLRHLTSVEVGRLYRAAGLASDSGGDAPTPGPDRGGGSARRGRAGRGSEDR